MEEVLEYLTGFLKSDTLTSGITVKGKKPRRLESVLTKHLGTTQCFAILDKDKGFANDYLA